MLLIGLGNDFRLFFIFYDYMVNVELKKVSNLSFQDLF